MVLGTYKEVVTGRSTDKEIQKIAQDGGIVSALFCYALDEKIIDGAVVAGPANEMWKPEPMVAMSSDEDTRRSRYQIHNIHRTYGA